jgi:response regulator RpfG family c-di-GMP phosphodiesterase
VKKNILFVDDEHSFLAGLKRMLHDQHREWEMYFANGVDEALGEINKIAFDTVVSDISMPGKDGFELLRTLQESEATRDIPIIILSGRDEHDLKRRALQQGAADLLNKPINREDLLARLNSVLRLKSYQDELKNQNEILDHKVKERTAELEESRLDIILRLAKAAEYRDEETGDHIIRVGCYCRAIAEELQMEREFVEMIFLTSPLHDIGKIGIPDTILLKPGKLTPLERSIMEQHCAIGFEILQQEPNGLKPFLEWHRNHSVLERIDNTILEMASTIALYHHEKWDGSGYPKRLKGENIPLAARITALADVYDALRTERPYKSAYSEGKTLAIMKEEKKHFDPMVFAVFETVTDIFCSIHNQFSDRTAVVEENTNIENTLFDKPDREIHKLNEILDEYDWNNIA